MTFTDNAPYRFNTAQLRAWAARLNRTAYTPILFEDLQEGVRVSFEDGAAPFDDFDENPRTWRNAGHIERRTSDGQWVHTETYNADDPIQYNDLTRHQPL